MALAGCFRCFTVADTRGPKVWTRTRLPWPLPALDTVESAHLEGTAGQLYAMVLAEQQADPPTSGPDGTGSAVLAAVRSFQDDQALAASPLAPPTGSVGERAAAVRQQSRREPPHSRRRVFTPAYGLI